MAASVALAPAPSREDLMAMATGTTTTATGRMATGTTTLTTIRTMRIPTTTTAIAMSFGDGCTPRMVRVCNLAGYVVDRPSVIDVHRRLNVNRLSIAMRGPQRGLALRSFLREGATSSPRPATFRQSRGCARHCKFNIRLSHTFLNIRSTAAARRTLKRDEHGARSFLHLEMRRLACVHGRRTGNRDSGLVLAKSYDRWVLHAVRTLRSPKLPLSPMPPTKLGDTAGAQDRSS